MDIDETYYFHLNVGNTIIQPLISGYALTKKNQAFSGGGVNTGRKEINK